MIPTIHSGKGKTIDTVKILVARQWEVELGNE